MKPTIFNHINNLSDEAIVAVLPKNLYKVKTTNSLKAGTRKIVWFTALLQPINKLVFVGMKKVSFDHAYRNFLNGDYAKGEAKFLDYITSNMHDPNVHHAVCTKLSIVDIHESFDWILPMWGDAKISHAYDLDHIESRHCLVEMQCQKTAETFCIPLETSLPNLLYLESEHLADKEEKFAWLSNLIKRCGQHENNHHTNSMLFKLYIHLTTYEVKDYGFISEANHDFMVTMK